MSLSAILDDIQDNVTNVHVSTEHVVLTQQNESTFQVATPNLNKDILSKFNTLYQTLTAKNTIYPLNKVDYRIAQEVFTMLPDIHKTEQAKLTSTPSAINKDILQGVLANVPDTMPEEILAMFREILDQIRSNGDNILNVVEAVKAYGELCKAKSDWFSTNRPLVIANRESVDLFQEDLLRCSYIDDTQLEYPKYSGELSKKFEALAMDPTLTTFLTYRSNPEEGKAVPRYPEISLFGVCEKIIHLKDVLQSEQDFLANYVGSLDSALNEEVKAVTANSSYLVNNATGVMDSLNFFKMLHDILAQDDQFFEKTKNLLEFLD